MATGPDHLLGIFRAGLLAVQPLRRRTAGALVVGVQGALVLRDLPIELAEHVSDHAGVVVELAVNRLFVLHDIAGARRHAGERRRPAPAVLRVDDEGEALRAVIQQVLAPKTLFVRVFVVSACWYLGALGIADHLPRQRRRAERERADRTHRDQRLRPVDLRVVLEVTAHALGNVHDRAALVANDRLRRRELHFERRTAVRALDRATLQRFLGRFGEAGHRELADRDRSADRPARSCGFVGAAHVAVIERADLAARVAQVADDEAAVELRWDRQFALRCEQLRGRDRRDRPRLPRNHHLRARLQARRARRIACEWHIERDHVATVVFAQPARFLTTGAAIEQRMPLVPGALGVFVLQPADQREGRTLVGAGGAELQRRVVVEQLGTLADFSQRVALAHDRALAKTADGESRRCRSKLDRRAAVRARRAVDALRRGNGSQATKLRKGKKWPRPASSAAPPSSCRTRPG